MNDEPCQQCQEEMNALRIKLTTLRKKYDALYTQALEASRRRRALERCREERGALAERVAVLEADKERLDWMTAFIAADDNPDLIDLREAIDAALEAGSQPA